MKVLESRIEDETNVLAKSLFLGKLFAYGTRYVSVDPILDPKGQSVDDNLMYRFPSSVVS